jgi:hypothetical protein
LGTYSAGHIGHTREIGNAYIILVGKPQRKRPLARPMHTCMRVILRWIFVR